MIALQKILGPQPWVCRGIRGRVIRLESQHYMCAIVMDDVGWELHYNLRKPVSAIAPKYVDYYYGNEVQETVNVS
jgi:hypothetical protein